MKTENYDLNALSDVALAEVQGAKVAILQSAWHQEHTNRMVEACAEILCSRAQIEVSLFKVSGCYELPLAAKRLLQPSSGSSPFQALITFGAIVKGDTDHYQVILDTCIRELGRVMLDSSTPIIMEVLPVHKLEDLIARSTGKANKGIEAAIATIQTIAWHRKPQPVQVYPGML